MWSHMSPFLIPHTSAQGSSPQQSSLGQPHPQKVRTQEASPIVGQTPFHHTSLPVPAPHPLPTRLLTQLRPLLPRSFSLDPLMERRWDLDLTYVTERILAASFPARPDEQRHRGHLRELAHVLQSKHRDKYLVRGGTCCSQPMRGLGGPEGPGSSLTSNLWRRGPEWAGPRTLLGADLEGRQLMGLSKFGRALVTSSFWRKTLTKGHSR